MSNQVPFTSSMGFFLCMFGLESGFLFASFASDWFVSPFWWIARIIVGFFVLSDIRVFVGNIQRKAW